MRRIRKIHSSIYAPIDDLTTYRPMPTSSLNHLDPFLFLNHHGPQTYPQNNNGLPFGPHPHRGFETLTFILKGDIMHKDSSGGESVIREGGIQWMTAGSGLIHSEISSNDFLKNGGEEEVIQLWLNLPSKLKMTPPKYTGKTREELKHLKEDDERVIINLVSGEWKGTQGPVDSLTGLTMAHVEMKAGGTFSLEISEEEQILFYVVNGEVSVNNEQAKMHELVEFEHEGRELVVSSNEDSQLILGHGKPFNEPIIAHGPFVMNSHEEIRQAFQDYQSGKMGTWN